MTDDDPNLQKNWDWTSKAKENAYFDRPGAMPGKLKVDLPFSSAGNKLFDSKGDYFEQDGWMLVHRDFGIEEDAPAMPFFTLYNKYRGIFRIILFNANQLDDSLYTGELSFHDPSRSAENNAPIFTFSNTNGKCFRSDFDPLHIEVSISPMNKYNGWAVFDFPLVGYDPSLDQKDPLLLFTLRGLDQSKITLNGKGDLHLVQELSMSPGFGASPDNLSKAMTAGVDGYRTYKSVRTWVDNEATNPSNEKEFWFPLVKAAAGSGTLAYAPYVAAAAVFVDAWFGGSNKASAWEPLTFRGQMNFAFAGGITKEKKLLTLPLYLNTKDLKKQVANGYRPVQETPWGVFNVEEAPSITGRGLHFEAGLGIVKTRRLAAEPKIHVNPKLGMDLVSKTFMLASWQTVGTGIDNNKTFNGCHPLTITHEQGVTQSRGDCASHLIVKLNFKTKVPTRDADDEYTVLKQVPLKWMDTDGSSRGGAPYEHQGQTFIF